MLCSLHCKDLNNVLLIVADDVGQQLPVYNKNLFLDTPNLLALAKRGLFRRSYVSVSSGSPNRAAMLTGK